MKQDTGQFFDFSDDGTGSDDSYLLRDAPDDTDYWRVAARPLNRILRDARLRLGLTQQKMADLMGVSVRSYKSYELQDVRKVPATALQLLVEHTGMSAADLLTGHSAPIDYDAVIDEVCGLQSTIWDLCQRPDGNEYGMNSSLPVGEALELAIMLLKERDRRRVEQNKPDLQVTQRDILEAIEECTDFNRCADWEWERDNDPAYYGLAPFPCPAMYAVPKFADMPDYRRYSKLRHEIRKKLAEGDSDLYCEWLGLASDKKP